MTDGSSGTPGDEQLGSVGEEAAKLFDALQDWVKEGGPAGAGGPADGPGGGLGDQWRSVNEHFATGGGDCLYCPVCQVVRKVREASPEVRAHLAVATSSLLQAAATLVEARAPRSTDEPRVTKIDLDDQDGAGSTS